MVLLLNLGKMPPKLNHSLRLNMNDRIHHHDLQFSPKQLLDAVSSTQCSADPKKKAKRNASVWGTMHENGKVQQQFHKDVIGHLLNIPLSIPIIIIGNGLPKVIADHNVFAAFGVHNILKGHSV